MVLSLRSRGVPVSLIRATHFPDVSESLIRKRSNRYRVESEARERGFSVRSDGAALLDRLRQILRSADGGGLEDDVASVLEVPRSAPLDVWNAWERHEAYHKNKVMDRKRKGVWRLLESESGLGPEVCRERVYRAWRAEQEQKQKQRELKGDGGRAVVGSLSKVVSLTGVVGRPMLRGRGGVAGFSEGVENTARVDAFWKEMSLVFDTVPPLSKFEANGKGNLNDGLSLGLLRSIMSCYVMSLGDLAVARKRILPWVEGSDAALLDAVKGSVDAGVWRDLEESERGIMVDSKADEEGTERFGPENVKEEWMGPLRSLWMQTRNQVPWGDVKSTLDAKCEAIYAQKFDAILKSSSRLGWEIVRDLKSKPVESWFSEERLQNRWLFLMEWKLRTGKVILEEGTQANDRELERWSLVLSSTSQSGEEMETV
jgi:hypothetical protein